MTEGVLNKIWVFLIFLDIFRYIAEWAAKTCHLNSHILILVDSVNCNCGGVCHL